VEEEEEEAEETWTPFPVASSFQGSPLPWHGPRTTSTSLMEMSGAPAPPGLLGPSTWVGEFEVMY